ncbi:ABC transporter ATP-binding protein [Crassaminicella profunda]|uniref:ABC transporter ATP-binding protein n=1 Tax=Crassaminicella profunda TaxID=1286698 RepID=UPI001CA77B90|nr:ABC transporter ATP-binding protein [Crassaminicella profunda]QZY54895.1 ABC transporter ATP-binding protein [Crassaminicella profunda]
MNKNVIYMKDIVKSYRMGKNTLTVLKDVSLDIQEGEFVAILGPSGSGKSTLMNIIGCIDMADSGEYSLAGEDIKARNEDELALIRNKEIGFIFQKFNLLSKYTALHNVAFPLLLRGMKIEDSYIRAKELLERVGLGDRVDHKPMELSGGQQQRVSIARALAGNPRILLADEPTGALDSQSGSEIMDMFLELNEEGNTIILITHDLEIAKKAKRIIHVKDGKVYE